MSVHSSWETTLPLYYYRSPNVRHRKTTSVLNFQSKAIRQKTHLLIYTPLQSQDCMTELYLPHFWGNSTNLRCLCWGASVGARQTLRFCAGNPEEETAWHRHSERQWRPTGSGCSERPRGCRTWRWGSSLAQPHAWRSSAGARPSAGRETHTWLYVRGIKDSYISKYPSIKIDIHTDNWVISQQVTI